MAKKKWVVDLDMGQNEVQNAVEQNLASAPSPAKEGQHYWDTSSKKWYIYDGSNWVDATNQGKTYTFQDGITESAGNVVSLDKATTSAIGGVIVGTNLSVNNGTISVADASESVKGVIEIATDTEASTGTDTTRAINAKQLATKVTANTAITAGTATKVTYDTKGLVTAGGSLVAADIPDISATYVTTTRIGAANGVAGLGADGKVPSSQLPSFVDDVIDAYIVSGATPLSAGWLSLTEGGSVLTPETGKIYVVLTDGVYKNKTYRWSGSTYVEISAAPGQATESTPGIAAIATQAEVTTGSNNTKFVTPLKLATYTSGMAKKFAVQNSSLTASGGVCTWSITNSLSTADVGVHVYEVSTGDEVMCAVNVASGTITIKINSASNIAADTYRAVIIG